MWDSARQLQGLLGGAERSNLRQHLVCPPDGRELAVETCQRESMHLLGTMVIAVRARALERGCAIGDHDCRETEVRRHAGG